MIKPLILFGLQTDLAFPPEIQEIFVAVWRVFGRDQLRVVTNHVRNQIKSRPVAQWVLEAFRVSSTLLGDILCQ
jgi:hypothetical protein